jgi:predicted DNA-binding transcriptional regulator YafY
MKRILVLVERLIIVDRLIRQKETGTPTELAMNLGVSRSQMYRSLNQLRKLGAIIKYNRSSKSYEYVSDFKVTIERPLRVVDKRKRRDI